MVLDFGLACLTEEEGTRLTRSGSFFGTPSYMSPEQVATDDEVEIDRRTDVWSSGGDAL